MSKWKSLRDAPLIRRNGADESSFSISQTGAGKVRCDVIAAVCGQLSKKRSR
jgi:hypothetical protein